MNDQTRMLVLAASLFATVACNKTCKHAAGVELDEHLFSDVVIDGRPYCATVNAALLGDSSAIKELSVYARFDGVAAYQHGAVLIEIVNTIHEDRYLKVLGDLSPYESTSLANSLEAGIDYADTLRTTSGCTKRSLECIYPLVHSYIAHRSEHF